MLLGGTDAEIHILEYMQSIPRIIFTAMTEKSTIVKLNIRLVSFLVTGAFVRTVSLIKSDQINL